MRPVINSKKHYVQTTLASITGQGVVNITLINTIEGAPTVPSHVGEGSIVKAVFVELWVLNSAANIASFTVAIYKNPGGSNVCDNTEMANLHDYKNKKNILFTSQGIMPRNSTFPMGVIRTWIKVPKSKQRFGLGDTLLITIRNNTTDDLNFCGITTYKEYS